MNFIKLKYLLYLLGAAIHSAESFLQDARHTLHKSPQGPQFPGALTSENQSPRQSSAVVLRAKLWDRLQVQEDDEPMWYVLNCVAGLEIDLLRQCRITCEDMEDAEKFVVPMVTTTRSHGANRMVQDTKVKYQGYVFAKLRLCEKTYEAIQGLDLCRSWMGTINQKGHRKLPPAPVCLNEVEIENFGLEDLEAEEVEEEEEQEGDVILDTEEKDSKDRTKDEEIEEIVQTVYLGLRVDDMIKVTAKNKFYNEDGIVRRLKNGKVFIRFYTYGSMFDEWLDPGDVRKLSNIEILKGLSGPSKPITQREIEGGNDSRYQSGPRDRRNMNQGLGGRGPRNRRQDRVGRSYQDNSGFDERKNRENWNWYKDNERRKQGGGFSDGDFDIRGSNPRSDWAGSDVDSQWGRGGQRRDTRGDRRQRGRRQDRSNEGDDDWSSFVSPVSSKQSKDETDDFFASLMTDLSNNLDSEDGSEGGASGNRNAGSSGSSDEDDFFASLLSEIADEPEPKEKSSSSSDDGDDFFAALSQEIGEEVSKRPKKKQTNAPTDLDDFFSEISSLDTGSEKSTDTASDEADDFFASLEAELDSELSEGSGFEEDSSPGDDFSLSTPEVEEVASPQPKAKKAAGSSGSPSSGNSSEDLSKYTVPVLKGMLKDRGLKVSGKKAELIERLTAAP